MGRFCIFLTVIIIFSGSAGVALGRNDGFGGPVIDIFSPMEPLRGWAGDKIILQGENFGFPPGKVYFDDWEADVDWWTDSQITVIVPPGKGQVEIRVEDDRGRKSNGRRFDYRPSPYLDYLASDQERLRPGDEIILRGKNFGFPPGKVYFDDEEADVDWWIEYRITAIVPPGKDRVEIRIETAQGQKSNGRRFDYIPPPYLDYLWSSEDHGRPGEEIVFKGNYFGKRKGKVFFDNREAKVNDWDDRSIRVTVPPGKGGVDIRIEDDRGRKSNSRRFTYIPPPYLDYLWSNEDHGRPGDGISLKGKYFGKRKGKVFFNNREAAVNDWDDRIIKAIVPPGKGGTEIWIENAQGQKSNSRRFKYLPDPK